MAKPTSLQSSSTSLPNSLDEINAYYYTKGYTDGLPIVPPTADRVRAMLDYVGRGGNEVVAKVAPIFGDATVEKIAINAVMAGCEPRYMPVLIAAVEAMAEEQFNLHGIQSTTNPAAPMLIINGPIRHELDINCSSGALGPGWKANASIGRAVRLILLNIGGGTPGDVDKATHGMPGKYTFCFGENEEESPWEPLHVERGFDPQQSTVTVFGAHGTHNNIDIGFKAEDLLHTLSTSLINIGVNNFNMAGGDVALLLCPAHAQILAGGGYSKQQIKEHLFQNVRAPIDWFSDPNRARIMERGTIIDTQVPLITSPDMMVIFTVGGAGGLHSVFIPCFGFTMSVTRVIQPR